MTYRPFRCILLVRSEGSSPYSRDRDPGIPSQMLPATGTTCRYLGGTAFRAEGIARACKGPQARTSLECSQDKKHNVSGASPDGRGGVEPEG